MCLGVIVYDVNYSRYVHYGVYRLKGLKGKHGQSILSKCQQILPDQYQPIYSSAFVLLYFPATNLKLKLAARLDLVYHFIGLLVRELA